MAKFRVALSGDFVKADGSPTYPMFDLTPLTSNPKVEVGYVQAVEGVMPGKELADYDALILLVPKFNAASMAPGGRLGVVARFGVGYDSVDVPACTAGDVALCITPDGVRRPVAVSILTFMLALTGKLMVKDQLTRQGPDGFNKRAQHMGVGLVGKTLGSIGIGNIGAELFRLARPLDMKFMAHDPFADKAVAKDLGIELVPLERLFREADVLCVNCPLTPETKHIVNAERLALMKPTAYLINTARGGVVNEADLYDALKNKRIAGAGLDVFDQEPPGANPLLTLDNVVFTAHTAGVDLKSRDDMAGMAARAIARVLTGDWPADWVVNPAVKAAFPGR